MSKQLVITACALAVSGLAFAKLPPLDDAAKAKAAETAAKAAWQAKIDAFQLCKVQDRVAAHYRKSSGSRPPVTVPGGAATPVSTAAATAAAPAAATAAPAAATAAPAAATAAAATPANAANPTTKAEGGGTPTAAGAPAAAVNISLAACTDPGPFTYNPPAQTPLETSGAHSPAGNAAAPPSVKPNSAEMAPAQPAIKK